MDVENGCYLVRSQNKGDYEMVLTQGPWVVFGHYLMVQPRIVDFNRSKNFPSVVLTWTRFTSLPSFLYKRKIMEEIESLVGKVAHLYLKTYNRTRGRFTRMDVYVDLNKTLISQVLVNDKFQRVGSEALSTVCFTCGRYGHVKDICPSKKAEFNIPNGKENGNNPLTEKVDVATVVTEKVDAVETLLRPLDDR